jgi:hypothetical protein
MARGGTIVSLASGLDAFLIGRFLRKMANGNVMNKSLLIPGHRRQLHSQPLQRQGRSEMSDPIKDGGPAFPVAPVIMNGNNNPMGYNNWAGIAGVPLTTFGQQGMSLRDYFAAHSPITWEVAAMVYGGRQIVQDRISKDGDRVAIFSVWTLMNYEYADAMIAQREEK